MYVNNVQYYYCRKLAKKYKDEAVLYIRHYKQNYEAFPLMVEYGRPS